MRVRGVCVYRVAHERPAPGTFRRSRRGPRSGAATVGVTTETWTESKWRAWRRSCNHDQFLSTQARVFGNRGGTHLGVRVDLEAGGGGVERRDLGDVVVLALTLLLLELERNTTDGTLLDTLHQVGREASNLVAKAF